MDMNLFDKLKTIFGFLTSSFMTIEILLIILFLVAIIILNIKKENYIMKFVTILIPIMYFVIIVFVYRDYAVYSFDKATTFILDYFYFPSTAVYFLIMLFVTVCLIYTICSKKLSYIIKIINTITFGVLYLFYILFIIIVNTQSLNMMDKVSLYSSDIALSIVQISNLILLFWILFVLIYRLYKIFRNSDNEKD